ncbi:unnamed protein product [Soboliphyme baturini]|uniref:Ubiquitin carboxyl-terminal hydrolase n=1 Tax=Soboliphyme baturini TaxID=241478 RepID=A0A183INJ3_9BILA|nr:unnamed protein product [Soboliphyme baturini]
MDATCSIELHRAPECRSVVSQGIAHASVQSVAVPSLNVTDHTQETTTLLVDSLPEPESKPQPCDDDVCTVGQPTQPSSHSELSEFNDDTRPLSSPTTVPAPACVVPEPSPSSRVARPPSPLSITHDVKWITFNNAQVPIVTQNLNGPCPLISVVNLLALRSQIAFPADTKTVNESQLLEIVGDCIIQSTPKPAYLSLLQELAQRPDYQKNMNDALSVLPNLITGLDVNVKFTGIFDFEYTPECIIFDLLNIRLCHGWLVDPEDVLACQAINSLSYNQLVEKIIAGKTSADLHETSEALIANDFLEQNASQLTYHGILELNKNIQEGEFIAFFRNNHFSTMLKHRGELFILVSDQGFLKEVDIVWETLNNVEGDSRFVDSRFQTVTRKTGDSGGELASVTDIDRQVDTE